MAYTDANGKEFDVGDYVQIRTGAIDVTNGVKSNAGWMYNETGPLQCEVRLIDPNWYTGGAFGLSTNVVKVRCTDINGSTVVWQVEPKDIVLRQRNSEPTQTEPEPIPDPPKQTEMTNPFNDQTSGKTSTEISTDNGGSAHAFAMRENEKHWAEGTGTIYSIPGKTRRPLNFKTQESEGNISGQSTDTPTGSSVVGDFRKLKKTNNTVGKYTYNETKSIGNFKYTDFYVSEGAITPPTFTPAIKDANKKKDILNENRSIIQNGMGFPVYKAPSNPGSLIAAKYDYSINLNDETVNSRLNDSFANQLMEARAAFGLPVHGSHEIARAMKYYMYNRFKTPDTNMAHNKSFTHIFFTRPDLNVLTYAGNGQVGEANAQIMNHTEGAMIWRRYPELLKLLTDYKRCGDDNNFNMLLSNQVQGIDISDEKLDTFDAGKSWRGYSIVYGDGYSGRTAGEFTCTFTETDDYSVFNLIKFWITYIDNVSKGAWHPSYNLYGANRVEFAAPGSSKGSVGGSNWSHVYTKTLDYAASAYVFKCGADGDDVLFWTKYYGVFPVNTSSNSFSADFSKPVGDTPNLNISFRYSFKKDMSPISLLEFNHVANVPENVLYQYAFNENYGHVARPYVGAPFIEMDLADTRLRSHGVETARKNTQIRLRFRPTDDTFLTDEMLYKSNF